MVYALGFQCCTTRVWKHDVVIHIYLEENVFLIYRGTSHKLVIVEQSSTQHWGTSRRLYKLVDVICIFKKGKKKQIGIHEDILKS